MDLALISFEKLFTDFGQKFTFRFPESFDSHFSAVWNFLLIFSLSFFTSNKHNKKKIFPLENYLNFRTNTTHRKRKITPHLMVFVLSIYFSLYLFYFLYIFLPFIQRLK